MDDESVERIELKLAYLERANQELSDVVHRQQQELHALRAQLRALLGRIASLQDEPTSYSPEQERPPHY